MDDIRQQLLNFVPSKDEAIEIFKWLGLSDKEIEERLRCDIDQSIIFEEVHKIIDELKAFSDIVLDKFAEVMNIGKDHRFSFKTEFLFKAVYFLRKKAYAQYIIENEGKPRNQISTSGIGVKSDVPEITNKMMLHIFKVIIYTNADKVLITKAVNKWGNIFKQKLKERSIEILTPCGFNRKLEDYNTLPDCVRGMLLYNMLTKEEVFKYGSKGFKIYAKGIHPLRLGYKSYDDFLKDLEAFAKKYNISYNKKVTEILNRIVIPTDMDTIPDWIQLDSYTILDKVFYAKANEILAPFQITVGSNEQMKRELDGLF